VEELELISDKVAIENLQLSVVKSAIKITGYEAAFVKSKIPPILPVTLQEMDMVQIKMVTVLT
jgi:hypothetical protein